MAKASVVASMQQQQLARIEAKLDLLLKESGIVYENHDTPGEPPKPIKSYAVPIPSPTPVVEEHEPVKLAKKGKS